MSITLPEDLATKLKALARYHKRTPAAILHDLLDAAPVPPTEPQLERRTPGLGRGTIWVSDDFDAPPGDGSWSKDT